MYSLPTELCTLIAWWVRETDVDYKVPSKPRSDWTRSRDLWRLSRASRAWNEICRPFVYEFFVLQSDRRFERDHFTGHVAPLYGHLIRAFDCTSPSHAWLRGPSLPVSRRREGLESWAEVAEVVGALRNLRTLFAAQKCGWTLLTTLCERGLTRQITTLDYRLNGARGVHFLDGDSDGGVDPALFSVEYFPLLEDLSVTHRLRTYASIPAIADAPDSSTFFANVLRLPHLRQLTLQGFALRKLQRFDFLPSYSLTHLNLLHSFVDPKAAIALTSLCRESLEVLGIGFYSVSGTSSVAELDMAPLDLSRSFDLPHLRTLSIRMHLAGPTILAFATSTQLQKIELLSIGSASSELDVDGVKAALERFGSLKSVAIPGLYWPPDGLTEWCKGRGLAFDNARKSSSRYVL